jgi:hypothetical protein
MSYTKVDSQKGGLFVHCPADTENRIILRFLPYKCCGDGEGFSE